MVNVIVEQKGFCKGCQLMELRVRESTTFYANNEQVLNSQTIKCIHEDSCNRTYNFTRQFYEDYLGKTIKGDIDE